MDEQRFRTSPTGSLVPINGVDGRTGEPYEHFAFVPEPLTELPSLGSETWMRVARASHALGRLEQGSQLTPTPGLLRAPPLPREAQSTSALEGTYAPLDEVLAAEVLDLNTRSAAMSEVLNYVEAAEIAFSWVVDRPVTVGLVEHLQSVLVRGTEADTREAGAIRTVPVAIGTRGGSIYDARFVPMPPGSALETGFRDLLDWIDREDVSGRDPVVNAAMAHYQFETLHPFNDGNGRLGRLLIVLQLLRSGTLSEPILSVSPWFEARRERYQDALAAVSADGAWDPWIRFFAEGIEQSALDASARMADLLELLAVHRDRIRSAGARGVVLDIADLLVGTPFVTVPFLAAQTGKTYQAASNAVNRLVELGILQEVEQRGTRVFRATEVLRITARPARTIV